MVPGWPSSGAIASCSSPSPAATPVCCWTERAPTRWDGSRTPSSAPVPTTATASTGSMRREEPPYQGDRPLPLRSVGPGARSAYLLLQPGRDRAGSGVGRGHEHSRRAAGWNRRRAAGGDGVPPDRRRYLVYLTSNGTLLAARYDAGKHLAYRPVTLLGGMRREALGEGQFDVAPNGTLVYAPGTRRDDRPAGDAPCGWNAPAASDGERRLSALRL